MSRISLFLFCALSCANMASAQWLNYPLSGIPRMKDGKPNLSAPVPRTPSGTPDLSGLWIKDKSAYGEDLKAYMIAPNEIAPMRPEAEAIYKERVGRQGGGRPSESCLPHSIPDAMIVRRPFQIVQTPGRTIILYEFETRFRQIFTDGRGHPKEIELPAWLGYSIGRWDQDTFVVDTIGFNDKSWLDDIGLPHTDALHTIERFHRFDFGHMRVDITIDDPKAYTKPFTATIGLELMPDTELIEDMCDTERDAAHILK